VNADLLDGINSTGFALSSHNHSGAQIISGTIADARLSSNVGLLNNTQGWAGRNNFSHPMNIFSGDGAGLTNLNASNLTSGILPNERLSGTYSGTMTFSNAANSFTGSGAGLTGVDADLLDGLNSTAFLQSVPNPLSLSSLQAGSHVVRGINTATASNSAGVQGESPAIGVRGRSTGTAANSFGGHFKSDSPLGTGVHAESIGTTGVLGRSSASSGLSFGGVFESWSTSGTGAFAWATAGTGATNGVWGISSSTDGRGVYGSADASSGTTYGGFFECNSPSGYGVYASTAGTFAVYGRTTKTTGETRGGYFQSISSSGTGVFGAAHSATGVTYAGQFQNLSSSGYGVYAISAGPYGVVGISTDTNSGSGGWFETNAPIGNGVYGRASSTSGVTYGVLGQTDSVSGRGVHGVATTTSPTNTPYGVLGTASVATLGFGVYALGDMGASGVKPFRIDHPRDPLNKYLLHYSTESPFPQNFYSGNVVTDGGGRAWVDLPEYFGDINTNYKYQLTVVDESDDFILAKVSREIQGNRFQIRTSKGHIKVSWRVEADRDDQRVRFDRPSDVVDKTGHERGVHQHPEYFAEPEEGHRRRPR